MLLRFRIPLMGFFLSFRLGTTLAAIENLAFYGVWLGAENNASILRVRPTLLSARFLLLPIHPIISHSIKCQHILPHFMSLVQSIQRHQAKANTISSRAHSSSLHLRQTPAWRTISKLSGVVSNQ